MPEDDIDALQRILTETDTFLRDKLKEAALEVAHLVLAVDEDGIGVVRSNVSAADLQEMAELLEEISEEASGQEPARPN